MTSSQRVGDRLRYLLGIYNQNPDHENETPVIPSVMQKSDLIITKYVERR